MLGIDFELTAAQFDRIRELVREHTGIALSEAKRQLVYGRLARRLRALRLDNFGDYIKLLEKGEPAELEEFTNAVTTNLTSFFREPHHFELPGRGGCCRRWWRSARLRAACASGAARPRPARSRTPSPSCCARRSACSTGWDVKLLATDLDSAVLATGAAGVYASRASRGHGAASACARFFDKGSGAQEGKFRVRDELRSLITFKQLNLMHEWPMRGPFDAIFCRNVIIYFDKATQRVLFERMATLQRPGDLLFLGHSESLYRVSDRYELIGRTIYRRLDN